jgi:hypothetical protein
MQFKLHIYSQIFKQSASIGLLELFVSYLCYGRKKNTQLKIPVHQQNKR